MTVRRGIKYKKGAEGGKGERKLKVVNRRIFKDS
jgi:hypothetical protein